MLSLLMRPSAPPIWLGLVVAAVAISAETLLVVVFRTMAPMDTFGVVYLLGALVVAIGWGTGLAAVTSVVSAFGFAYFRNWPDDSFDPTDLRNWVVIGVCLLATLMANTLAGVTRAAAAGAEHTPERPAALRRVATAVLVAAHGAAVSRERRSAPVVVDGKQWGLVVVSAARVQPFPAETEERL